LLDAQPLAQRLEPVRAAATKEDVARLMGRSIGGFGASFFGPGVSDDAKQPDIYSLAGVASSILATPTIFS